MLNERNRFLAMDILHRLEVKDSVSIEELIYLYRLANENDEVDKWLKKLLVEQEAIPLPLNTSENLFAA